MFTGLANKSEHNLPDALHGVSDLSGSRRRPEAAHVEWEDRWGEDYMLDSHKDGRRKVQESGILMHVSSHRRQAFVPGSRQCRKDRE
jgi:hypothetical protein